MGLMGLLDSALLQLVSLSQEDSNGMSVGAITLFVGLICACIVISRFIENSRWINESVIALLMGLGAGGIYLLATKGQSSRILMFNEDLFFIYLLPPIIFNAGFHVKKKQFFRNFNTITLFGVVGTLISFCAISGGAKLLFEGLGIAQLELRDYLAIGAIFSATDSVCTLQVLDQNDTPLLYSLVFGEGVVNDATTVVLFRAIQKFDLSHINVRNASKFFGSFFYLFTTSTLLGVVLGLLCAFTIRKLFYKRHSSNQEVALIFLLAYLSYVLAELFDWSGILTVFFCGIVMSHYTWHGITEHSRVTSRIACGTMSSIAETFIFLYVGMDALDIEKWRFVRKSPGTSFGASAVLLGLVMVARALFVFPLSFLSNLTKRNKDERFSINKQVTIWWAGLMRGAVSIALAYNQFSQFGHTQLPGNAVMITSTITIVLFSTVVFGLLTKPLVRHLLPQGPVIPLVQPLISDTERPESEDGDKNGENFNPRGSSILQLLSEPTNTVHHYWRNFDNAYMRPVFGGKGFTEFTDLEEELLVS